MTFAQNLGGEIRYVLKDDRGLEDHDPGKVVFIIKRLTARQYDTINNNLMSVSAADGESAAATTMKLGNQTSKALEFGLIRIENFHDSDGNPIPWSDQARESILDRLPQSVRAEVAGAILNESFLGDKTKN
jgi:hypothetical protein